MLIMTRAAYEAAIRCDEYGDINPDEIEIIEPAVHTEEMKGE